MRVVTPKGNSRLRIRENRGVARRFCRGAAPVRRIWDQLAERKNHKRLHIVPRERIEPLKSTFSGVPSDEAGN